MYSPESLELDVVVGTGVKMAVGVKTQRLFSRLRPPETRRWRPRLSTEKSSSMVPRTRERKERGKRERLSPSGVPSSLSEREN